MEDGNKLVAELQSLLADGRKMEAIKRYRVVTGAGLMEAKHRISAPAGSGCLGVFFFGAMFVASITAVLAADRPGEQALQQRYDTFVESLNHQALAKDYPEAVRKLDSSDPKEITIGLQTLAATKEPAAIAWMVPSLDSDDRGVRIYAGLGVSGIVASHELQRRDMTQPHTVVIKPPGPGDLDLAPLSWVVLKMLRLPDDGNTHSYAANMIGYLKLEEYEDDLRQLLRSRHPAVTRAAQRALEMLGSEPPFSPAELAAARKTGEAFARLFRENDEDALGLLLVPKELLPEILSEQVLKGKDVEPLYGKMVSANTQRFTEFRGMCGDLSKLSTVTFEPGHLVTSDFYAKNTRVMKNSFLVMAYANRVQIRIKIEEMVMVDGNCYIVEID